MKVQLALLSESTSLDRNTNKLSIFNVVDRWASLTFPLWIPSVSIVIVLVRENEPPNLVGKLQAKIGDTIAGEREINIKFNANNLAKMILNTNITIPAPGEVVFSLAVPDQTVELLRAPVQQLRPAHLKTSDSQLAAKSDSAS